MTKIFRMMIFFVILLFTFSSVSAQTSEITVPGWIKNNAGWWADGVIDDESFVQGLQYLIQNRIMSIPETKSVGSTNEPIPNWIKNNAGWWADGQIDDTAFVQGIQFLIQKGIIYIPQTVPEIIEEQKVMIDRIGELKDMRDKINPIKSTLPKYDITIGYVINGGTITEITTDKDSNSLLVFIDATNDGDVTLTLPRELIDSKMGDVDNYFFVQVNQEEIDYDEVTTSSDRTLTIPFREGSIEIEIIGTNLYVSASPPVAIINAVKLGVAYTKIVFTADKSYDPDGDIESYEWSFSDGTTLAGSKIYHVFTEQGYHQVTLIVTDSTGLASMTTHSIIMVGKGGKY